MQLSTRCPTRRCRGQVGYDRRASPRGVAHAGVSIEVAGEDLVLKASAPPDPDLLKLLGSHKTAIISALRGNHGWLAEDWQALFDERAGIMEFDGGLPREEAETLAAEEVAQQRQAVQSTLTAGTPDDD